MFLSNCLVSPCVSFYLSLYKSFSFFNSRSPSIFNSLSLSVLHLPLFFSFFLSLSFLPSFLLTAKNPRPQKFNVTRFWLSGFFRSAKKNVPNFWVCPTLPGSSKKRKILLHWFCFRAVGGSWLRYEPWNIRMVSQQCSSKAVPVFFSVYCLNLAI